MCHYQSNNGSYLIVLEDMMSFTSTSHTYFYFNYYNENYENTKFLERGISVSYSSEYVLFVCFFFLSTNSPP